jgi:membrane protease YdiL (CAAX protease family)
MPGKLGTKLNLYNSGTFVTGGSGDAGESMVLSLATAFCAGIGEETLMRGAVTPALGIVPAGILHGMLHEQFADSPVFIIQVAIWSCLFGILRKYTNTTTTIIGHAGFNLISTFLFAFNP